MLFSKRWNLEFLPRCEGYGGVDLVGRRRLGAELRSP